MTPCACPATEQARHDRDLALLARWRSGDRDALNHLFEELRSWMMSVAWPFLRNQADTADAVQEAMLKLWRALHGYDPSRASLRSYARRFIQNEAVSLARARARRSHLPFAVESALDSANDPAAAAEAQDERALVQQALEQMGTREREALLFRCQHGQQYSHGAQRLGIPVGTLASRVHRAKRRLRALLQGGRS